MKHLFEIARFLASSKLHPQDKTLFMAASLIAFYSLLRVSEYTCENPNSFSPSESLALSDIQFQNSLLFLRIKASKTDPFKQGVTVRIPTIKSVLCPVKALHLYLVYRGSSLGPLFHFHDGSLLTRNHIQWLLKQTPSKLNISTHSFRIGGATAAAAAGIPDSTIQTLGI